MRKRNLLIILIPLLEICITLGANAAIYIDTEPLVSGTLNKDTKNEDKVGSSGGLMNNTGPDVHDVKDTAEIIDIDANTTGHCTKLKNRYKPNSRTLYIHAKARDVVVFSSSREPSLATAALLATAIRYGIGYTNVITRIDERTTCEFATSLPRLLKLDGPDFDENIIHVDSNLDSLEDCPKLDNICSEIDTSCNVAGHRLQVMGTAVGLDVRLHASLSTKAAKRPDCFDFDTWYFYSNPEKLKRCGFLQNITNNNGTNQVCVPVLMPFRSKNMSSTMWSMPEIFCSIILRSRGELVTWLRNKTASYLFYDYDLWQDTEEDIVRIVMMPPEETISRTSKVTVRLADTDTFRQYAPRIRSLLTKFKPKPKDLRQVLDYMSNTSDIQEAACAWADTNFEKFNLWTNTSDTYLWVEVLLCDDNLLEQYKKVLHIIKIYINKAIEEFRLKVEYRRIDCHDNNDASQKWTMLTRSRRWQWLMGTATAGAGTAAAVNTASSIMGPQLMVYDVPPTRTHLHASATTSTGRLQPLTSAIQLFFTRQNWKRIAFISEYSILAEDLTADLVANENIIHKEVKINATTIPGALKSLNDFQAKIFFVNARFDIANAVICEASRLGMTTPYFAWIVREWHPIAKCAENVTVLTVSYSWRGWSSFYPDSAGANKILQNDLIAIFSPGLMPPFAASLADALLMMSHGLDAVLRKHPELRYDIHANGTNSMISKILEGNITVAGASQLLRQKQYALASPFVYLSSWKGNSSELLAVWRIDEDNNVKVIQNIKEVIHSPHDGTRRCLTTQSGDPFAPNCHDGVLLCSAVVILLTPLALWVARRARLKRLKDRDHAILIRFLARCQKTASLLSSYLVERSALELHEELGTGHFGRVSFGLLRLPNRAPASVAVKALLKDASAAEEAEFLREASALASLKHKHIVKLVGVCATDGPPLLLMEHAFFGDLLHYLRARYHLAEIHERDPYMHDISTVDAESLQVSPAELTRLAREAAEAVAYLVSRKMVHRDVRAANCLIDARRSLKLADFGLAREVGKKTNADPSEKEVESDYKYICQRRGVFPVPWMAPECLEHGEFSYASDVWALGVFILEVTTLGARPFGSWGPPMVLRYVRSGGRPLLPRDASYHTCEVTAMCWHPIPSERATARQVMEYLREHPLALRAALRPGWPEQPTSPDATDSGFGERDAEQEWITKEIRVSTL